MTVVVVNRLKGLGIKHLDTKLLFEFTLEGLTCGLTGLALAPRKFPPARIDFASRPACHEKSAMAIFNEANSNFGARP